jgi:hypothetical protein
VSTLSRTFKLKPLADWLEDFGSRGRSLMPLVVGTMLGLMYRDAGASLPIEEQPPSYEFLVDLVTGLGYGTRRAERVLELAEPELRTARTKEEAARIVVKYLGKEG